MLSLRGIRKKPVLDCPYRLYKSGGVYMNGTISPGHLFPETERCLSNCWKSLCTNILEGSHHSQPWSQFNHKMWWYSILRAWQISKHGYKWKYQSYTFWTFSLGKKEYPSVTIQALTLPSHIAVGQFGVHLDQNQTKKTMRNHTVISSFKPSLKSYQL